MDLAVDKEKILTYPIASYNVYGTAEGERTIYLRDDMENGIKIFGEIPKQGQQSTINFAELLQELAISIDTPGQKETGKGRLEKLCTTIGDALVEHIDQILPDKGQMYKAAYAIESILRSMEAEYIHEGMKNGMRYELIRCPLCAAERKSGTLNENNNAHYALDFICRHVISKIDPSIVHVIYRSVQSDHEIILIRGLKQN